MISLHFLRFTRRCLLLALPLAISLVLLFPAVSEAHAILLKSDPAADAKLSQSQQPGQVRMWFSEDLNPSTSSAYVINPANQRVSVGSSLVLPTDVREMDVSLQPNLPPSVYVVIWRTQSAADGHVLTGSFIFSIAGPDGTVPKVSGPIPGQTTATNSGAGQFDLPTTFSFLMITLTDLGVIFWVGAQLWRTFVLELSENDSEEQRAIERRAEERFARRFSLPTLRLLLLANIGILLGQALSVTGGRWDQIFAPSLLAGLLLNGHFGTFWLMRMIVIILAMAVGTYTILTRQRPKIIKEVLPWINLILGLALLIAVTLSGHAAAVSNNLLVYAVLIDWLHLLAASLWIGGMMYLSSIYLPVLKESLPLEYTRSLLTILPRFSPLAIVGVLIMAVTGPLNATVHMTSLDQLIITAYGRTLVIKSLLVSGLLLTSAIHVGLWRPRLEKDYKKYNALVDKKQQAERDGSVSHETITGQQVKQLEGNIAGQTARMSKVLRWEPALGIAVLLCTGLLSVFAGTLQPALPTPQSGSVPGQQTVTPVRPFNTTVKTSDNQFTIKLNVTPNRFGPNIFTVSVLDSKGVPDTNIGVSLYTRMMDMDMGVQEVNLQPDGKGNFTANGDLSMSGRWEIRIQIRTPQNTLHETKVTMITSS